MTVVEHLEELRGRLIKVLVCVGALSVAGYFYYEPILAFLAAPAKPHVTELYFFGPAAAFLVQLKVAVFSGLIFSSPFILYHVWMFVSPGLYEGEQKVVLPSVVISSFLFFAGTCFGYVVALPVGLGFLLGYQTPLLKPLLDVDEYLSFTMMYLAGFGIVFDLPVFVVGLVKLHVLKSSTLRKFRRGFILGAFIVAAVLTPPDVASQLLMAIPILILYEVSILAAVLVEKWEHRKKGSEV